MGIQQDERYNLPAIMAFSGTTKGEIYVLAQAVLWGLFPVITILLYESVGPLFAGSICTFLAALFFAIVLTVTGRWHEVFKRSAWFDIISASLILGVVFLRSVVCGIEIYNSRKCCDHRSHGDMFFFSYFICLPARGTIDTITYIRCDSDDDWRGDCPPSAGIESQNRGWNHAHCIRDPSYREYVHETGT
jgi:hypothetical protein